MDDETIASLGPKLRGRRKPRGRDLSPVETGDHPAKSQAAKEARCRFVENYFIENWFVKDWIRMSSLYSYQFNFV